MNRAMTIVAMAALAALAVSPAAIAQCGGCPMAATCAPPAAGPAGEAGATADFRTLFNGKDLSGWVSSSGGEPGAGWVVEDGAMARKNRAGDIWTKERFGDFVLSVEFKTAGNSGVFVRTDNPKDCVQTGIEIQVFNSMKPGQKHCVGALYDLQGPSKECFKPGEWNTYVITCNDNKVTVELNGQVVNEADLDKWTEGNKNPDGSKNKFKTALKDFKREGHVGLQDHGAAVSYRNVKIKPLNATKKAAECKCPVCGAKGKEGDYCAKCNAIITAYGEYKCNRCGKTVKSGTWCEKHNCYRFSVNNDEKCPKCGKTKGTWCPGCGKYACLPSVTYCEKCKKPFDRIKTDGKCPKCGTKVEATMATK